jgi:hypothetical protein
MELRLDLQELDLQELDLRELDLREDRHGHGGSCGTTGGDESAAV